MDPGDSKIYSKARCSLQSRMGLHGLSLAFIEALEYWWRQSWLWLGGQQAFKRRALIITGSANS